MRLTLLAAVLAVAACSSSPADGGLEQVGSVDTNPDLDELSGDTAPCVTDDDCQELAGFGCRVPRCMPSGECMALAEPDGTSCDDGNPCTASDVCLAGTCIGGANECVCEVDGDCDAWQDADLCKARLVCVDSICSIDPSTEVICEGDDQGTCFIDACDPATGTEGTRLYANPGVVVYHGGFWGFYPLNFGPLGTIY